jgi:hypothetical protein
LGMILVVVFFDFPTPVPDICAEAAMPLYAEWGKMNGCNYQHRRDTTAVRWLTWCSAALAGSLFSSYADFQPETGQKLPLLTVCDFYPLYK